MGKYRSHWSNRGIVKAGRINETWFFRALTMRTSSRTARSRLFFFIMPRQRGRRIFRHGIMTCKQGDSYSSKRFLFPVYGVVISPSVPFPFFILLEIPFACFALDTLPEWDEACIYLGLHLPGSACSLSLRNYVHTNWTSLPSVKYTQTRSQTVAARNNRRFGAKVRARLLDARESRNRGIKMSSRAQFFLHFEPWPVSLKFKLI